MGERTSWRVGLGGLWLTGHAVPGGQWVTQGILAGFWSGPALLIGSSNGLRWVTQGTLRFAVTADWGPSGCAGEMGLWELH